MVEVIAIIMLYLEISLYIIDSYIFLQVNFGAEPAWMEPLSGYTFTGKIPLEDRVLGTQAPEKREDAEVSWFLFSLMVLCIVDLSPYADVLITFYSVCLW